jgi:hypothetical protein
MVEAPAAPQPRDYTPRLRIVVMRMYQTASNSQDRQKFSNLLDLLLRSTRLQEWPLDASAEKATHPSQTAIIYAALVGTIKLIHDKEPEIEIADAVKFCEWATLASPGTFTVVGQQGVKFTMSPVK